LVKKLVKCHSFIVAADGGADALLDAGIVPDAVVGDLDSVSENARQKIPSEHFFFVPNQNTNDLEKALSFLSARGCTACTLAGFTGGREDFSAGNLLALFAFADNMQLCLAGSGWKIFPLMRTRSFVCEKGKRVSLIVLQTCQKVSLKGLKFPLKNTRLPFGTTRTLSNETTGKRFTVSLKSGKMLVYVED
jgi:thiamine pyrophosphokinase